MTARYLAVKALMRQEQNGYANLVLDSELKACKPPLSPRDAAFASGIFYTVLERRSLLDWMLAQFSKRPLEKLDAPDDWKKGFARRAGTGQVYGCSAACGCQ